MRRRSMAGLIGPLVARATGAGAAHLTLGAAVGALVAVTALDVQFIIGSGGAWVRPEGDFNVYLVAWHYFLGDVWRLPLFEVPAMGYPEGSNVVFSDILPLAACGDTGLSCRGGGVKQGVGRGGRWSAPTTWHDSLRAWRARFAERVDSSGR